MIPDGSIRRSGLRFVALVAAGLASMAPLTGCSAGEEGTAPLPQEEVEAVRALNLAYPEAWLSNDPDRVMETFAEDAVIIPALGTPPVEGRQAIQAFFWPDDSPPATVTHFDMEPLEIAGSINLAYVRGSMSLGFEMEDEELGPQVYSTEGNYLMVMRKDAESGWRIARYIWNHPPWELVTPAE
jgi:uncharacterized protein (TIGR02246 family)